MSQKGKGKQKEEFLSRYDFTTKSDNLKNKEGRRERLNDQMK